MADNKLEIDISANPKGIHKAVTELEKLMDRIDLSTEKAKDFKKTMASNFAIRGGVSKLNYKVDAKHINEMFGIDRRPSNSAITRANSMFNANNRGTIIGGVNGSSGIRNYASIIDANISRNQSGMSHNDWLQMLQGNHLGENVREVRQVGQNAEESRRRFDNFFASLRRIALYRAIRSALKLISSALKSGIENLYKWSRLNNGSFAKAMDGLTTSFEYLKNSIAVTLAPILQYVLIPLVTKLTNAVAEVINKFGYWLYGIKAVKTEAKYLKTELGALSIDEFNKIGEGLNEHSQSYAEMFDGVDFAKALGKLKEKIFGIELSDKIFKWLSSAIKNISWGEWGETLGGLIANTLKSGAFWQWNIDALTSVFKLVFSGLKGIFQGLFGSYITEEMAKLGDEADWVKVAGAIAKGIIKGICMGIANLSSYVLEAINSLIRTSLTSVFGERKWIADMFEGLMNINENSDANEYLKYYSGGFANGGYPTQGSLFLANENGAEMVGSIGGRTAVANNDQIVTAIKQGVYEAMVGANGGSQTLNANLYLDGKQIGKQVINYHNGIVKQTGASPLLV